MIKGPKKTVSIAMPMDLYLEIQKLAQETSRTTPAYIRQVLKRYLQHYAEHKDDPKDEWSIDT